MGRSPRGRINPAGACCLCSGNDVEAQAPMTTSTDLEFLDRIEPLFSAQQIQDRVKSMAEELSEYFGDKELVLVVVLRGSLVFAVDLLRYMTIYPEVEFLSASSYGNNLRPGNTVEIYMRPDLDLEGKELLVVEDIVDTGQTLRQIAARLDTMNPASVRYISMLYKRLPNQANWPVDWFGFEIPDLFVIGYGLDYRQKFRNLPWIGHLPH
ncbi:MAG: hypoxanthine phosphoribosyltransferase [Caldilineaceae bacterium SB0662_bin_9]|uniref:Hypoxanthine phosphoribosyltransferase n=1 Tax=Caldilineaceae bacterium SB0662_bin_9 TaxID=2605258 RepID=A0A6B1DP90_9CHLR|nr:hypoxanthine phosphoribosyltransferase [Caldilineaceae bacterium SB0662_bin_9]